MASYQPRHDQDASANLAIWHEANQSEQIHSFVSIKSISYDLVDYYVSTKDLHYENLNPLQHVGIVITI